MRGADARWGDDGAVWVTSGGAERVLMQGGRAWDPAAGLGPRRSRPALGGAPGRQLVSGPRRHPDD